MADSDLMRHAIRVARVAGVPFGAVLVRASDREVLVHGTNRSNESPTLHAEIDAINRCATQFPDIDWSQLGLYTTAEPCPMCQGAIEFAGIRSVHYGTSIPWLQKQGWWQIDLRASDIARRAPGGGARLVGGLLAAECNALFVPPTQSV